MNVGLTWSTSVPEWMSASRFGQTEARARGRDVGMRECSGCRLSDDAETRPAPTAASIRTAADCAAADLLRSGSRLVASGLRGDRCARSRSTASRARLDFAMTFRFRTGAACELLVRVSASSVNPADAAIASGMLKGMAQYEFPVILGRDFAGVLEEVGADVTRYEAGDAVFGFVLHANPAVHDGSWADYVVIPQDSVARAPEGVDLVTVGAAPVAALTALAALDALGRPVKTQSSLSERAAV